MLIPIQQKISLSHQNTRSKIIPRRPVIPHATFFGHKSHENHKHTAFTSYRSSLAAWHFSFSGFCQWLCPLRMTFKTPFITIVDHIQDIFRFSFWFHWKRRLGLCWRRHRNCLLSTCIFLYHSRRGLWFLQLRFCLCFVSCVIMNWNRWELKNALNVTRRRNGIVGLNWKDVDHTNNDGFQEWMHRHCVLCIVTGDINNAQMDDVACCAAFLATVWSGEALVSSVTLLCVSNSR